MKPITSIATMGAMFLVAATASMAAEPTGREVFDKHCVHCHGPGNEAAGTLQLARTRGKDMALLTERKDLGPEYIEYVVRHGLKSMPPFAPSDLTDAQLEALARYLAP
jgi:mono/diheme cytochrome c family protein